MYPYALPSSKVLVLVVGSHVAQALLEFDSQVRRLPVYILPCLALALLRFFDKSVLVVQDGLGHEWTSVCPLDTGY